ncbi:arylsulfatase [Chitinophaga barathri]|uniref:Arylsulfatase n=1 Tax=Chitinophaga barathri TaxID=1647451 RepID=A0A3N4MM71_9BACT|nr:arylsulfatase [Chitinophaga barathri]RPD41160.1 arylsulfatase [Chitinophaga barathri]
MKKQWLLAGMMLLTSVCMAQKKPNIVFIMADDLGLGDLGCYGQQKIKTPHIDKLAAQGMKFNSFYCGTSVCAPSRSSLLTGQHTGHTYVRGNKEIQPEGQEPLGDSVQTFAQLLQQAGYTTGAFGKWGLGMVGTSGAPDRKGFDKFFGYNCQRQSHRYYPTHLWNNDQKVMLDGNDLAHKVTYAPELIQQQALAFIDENKDKPFFLYIPTVLPHAELAGPDDQFYKMYENAFEEKPHKGADYGPNASIGGYQSVEKPRATFAAMVSRMDAQVGEVVARLEKYGLLENTIIIFTSDNGPHREGGADPAFFNSSAGLRGVKRDLYEGGVRTSFIVQWKGIVKAGSTSKFIGAFWDVLPTLTQITQAPRARYTDGISFLPTLLGKGAQKQHDYLYWEFHEDGGRQAVRAGKWKAVRQKVKTDPNGPIELYDLAKDPEEKHNIAAENPSIVKLMDQRMKESHVESPIFPLIGAGK